MPEISAVLIIKNEADCLQRCLTSLQSVVDEIVIADTGSTDESLTIAQTFTQQIFSFPWKEDFAAARNFALDQATASHALIIDADEYLDAPERARELLLTFIAREKETTVGTVEIVNKTGLGAEAQEVVDHTERFFMRAAYRYSGAIHEQLQPVWGEKTAAPTGLRLHHTGYMQAYNDPDHKALRNIRILKSELEKAPEDEYLLYQLAKAWFSLHRYQEAAEALEVALTKVDFSTPAAPRGCQGLVSREVLTGMVCSLAYAYINVNRVQDAARLLEEHAALGHPGVNRADFLHARGYLFLMLGQVPQARDAYQASMRYGATGEDVRGTGSFSSAYHLGLLAEADQDMPQALGHYLLSLQLKADYEVTLSRCIDLILEQGISLPPEIWAACDQDTLMRLYGERLGLLVKQGKTKEAGVLIQVAGSLSPEFLAHCKITLEKLMDSSAE